MEIERKFLIDKIPESIDLSGLKCRRIEQGYLCTEPVVLSHLQVQGAYGTRRIQSSSHQSRL